MDKVELSGRGGKREGAGRPITGRSTKVIRVPLDFPPIDVILHNLAVLEHWKQESLEASKTSPRWEKLRELLEELNN